VKTPDAPSAIVGSMNVTRSYPLFREAVLDLAAEPTPVNVRRYLAASRILTRSAQPDPKPRRSGRSERRTTSSQ
jgi:hypothetical protein